MYADKKNSTRGCYICTIDEININHVRLIKRLKIYFKAENFRIVIEIEVKSIR